MLYLKKSPRRMVELFRYVQRFPEALSEGKPGRRREELVMAIEYVLETDREIHKSAAGAESKNPRTASAR